MGVIMGTAAYMAPEQAKGKVADKRADVWAFGVVLYEMLTGRRTFEGGDVSEVMAKVITLEPEWDALPTGLPPALETYLRRCVQKDPRERIRDIGDVRLAMAGAFDVPIPPPLEPHETPVAVSPASGLAATRSRGHRRAGGPRAWRPRRLDPDAPSGRPGGPDAVYHCPA